MWVIAYVSIIAVWIYFISRAHHLAHTIDRGEVMVLKPLSLTYLILSIISLISGLWFFAIFCIIAWLLNGMLGASLHKARTFKELASGTLQYMQKGPRLPLSREESYRLAKAILSATIILGSLLSVLILQNSRWYIVIPTAFLSAFVFMAVLAFLVAYQRRPAKCE